MILTTKKSAIPKSLRDLRLWYVTSRGFGDDRIDAIRYSARTLTELRWEHTEDFVDYDHAFETCIDTHWLDAVAFKVMAPHIAIVAMDALDSRGRLSKYFRPIPLEVGGYWEKRNATDVLGIVCAESVPHTGFAWFRGFLIFVWNDGPAPISGQPVPGLNGDPVLTDQVALQRFFSEARWDSVWVSAKLKADEARRKGDRQMELFTEPLPRSG